MSHFSRFPHHPHASLASPLKLMAHKLNNPLHFLSGWNASSCSDLTPFSLHLSRFVVKRLACTSLSAIPPSSVETANGRAHFHVVKPPRSRPISHVNTITPTHARRTQSPPPKSLLIHPDQEDDDGDDGDGGRQ